MANVPLDLDAWTRRDEYQRAERVGGERVEVIARMMNVRSTVWNTDGGTVAPVGSGWW